MHGERVAIDREAGKEKEKEKKVASIVYAVARLIICGECGAKLVGDMCANRKKGDRPLWPTALFSSPRQISLVCFGAHWRSTLAIAAA